MNIDKRMMNARRASKTKNRYICKEIPNDN